MEIIETYSEPGSGSLPGESLPSVAIAIAHKNLSSQKIANLFKKNNPPIIGRIYKDSFLLDLRCIEDPHDLVPDKL